MKAKGKVLAKLYNREFVVGYKGSRQCVYGPDWAGMPQYIDRMTLTEARAYIKNNLRCRGKTIYRLVPIPLGRPRRGKKRGSK